jgi:hypothetical protein
LQSLVAVSKVAFYVAFLKDFSTLLLVGSQWTT